MSELFNILATYCGINNQNQGDIGETASNPYTSEPYALEPVACEPITCEPVESLIMEPRTIHRNLAVDNNDTTIYYNCVDFKEKFKHVKKTNNISECNSLLHRTLSCKDMYRARNIIFDFLQSQYPNSMCIYGTSSWGMVGHGLYYDDSKKLYGYYNGSFGITIYKMEKSFLENMYDDNDERLTTVRSITY